MADAPRLGELVYLDPPPRGGEHDHRQGFHVVGVSGMQAVLVPTGTEWRRTHKGNLYTVDGERKYYES